VGGWPTSLVRLIWTGAEAEGSRRLLGAITADSKGTMILIVQFCDCMGVEGGIWPPRLSIRIKSETSVCSKYIK
jgi:hypothetical protein